MGLTSRGAPSDVTGATDPSRNTDQGVWRGREYLGVKPMCAMKVKGVPRQPTLICC